MAYKKGLKIIKNVDCNDLFWGDPTRIKQILNNFISNAVKFTDEGYVEVSVILHSSDDFYEIEFVVEDTGRGLPKTDVENIFEPFEQADISTTRKYGGTGLGLSISSQLAKMMGGQITYSNKEGSGAKFSYLAKLEKV